MAVVLPWTGRCTKVAVGQAWFIRSMERFRELRLDAGNESVHLVDDPID